jgi:hypothetical protein
MQEVRKENRKGAARNNILAAMSLGIGIWFFLLTMVNYI